MARDQSEPTLTSEPKLDPQQLRDEHIRLLMQYVPLQIFAHTAGATILIALFWNIAPRTPMLIWHGVLLVAAVGALAAAIAYRRRDRHRRTHAWRNFVLVYHLAFGLLWGTVPFLVFHWASFEYRMLLMFVGLGIGSGSLSSISYLPAFYVFFPLALLPISAAFLREAGVVYLAFGGMVILYVAGMLVYATAAGRNLDRSLRLQLENEELARRLAHEKAQADDANLAKSRFLAAASHDLRQPLHAMMLFTSALDQHISNAAARGIVDNIHTSARAMEELFTALLDISRLDAEALKPELRHFDLEHIVRRVLNDFAPEAATKKLSLQHENCAVVVRSDPVLIERVLRNLVSNAIRYTQRGHVHLVCSTRGDVATISVIDSGIGFTPAEKREIFKEFHQLHNPERDRTKGLGLGLAIVERIARLLDVTLEVESSPGVGSRFSITVPMGDAAQAQALASVAEDLRTVDLGGLRVVVIDDEASVREGMRTLLEQWGCEVVLSSSEEEAVAAVRAANGSPRAIITDYRLRGRRTGAQAIARLHDEFGAHIPALIITGDIAPVSLLEARASGYPLVHKPVQPAMLRAFLRNASKVRVE